VRAVQARFSGSSLKVARLAGIIDTMRLTLSGRPLPALRRVRLYVCGITPYDTTHVGHAATFVWVDVLMRLLRHVGLEPELCRNITDVDDDLTAEAARRAVPPHTLATQQAHQFADDMRRLRVERPAFEPQSRDYVTDVVFLARALLDRGAAYERDGSVWFRGADAVVAAGLDPEQAAQQFSGAPRPGGQAGPMPDHPLDTPVWQRSAPGELSWASPWGDGRPGWHAECAAMATTVLGPALDVHAGGEDLRFPHHLYEAAMAEAATGVVPFARSWMHVGIVTYRGEKVAKSTGNLVFVFDLLQDWSAPTIRTALVDRPWSTTWDFTLDVLERAAERLEQLWSAAGVDVDDPAATGAALDALADDLDVSRALDIAVDSGGETARTVGRLLAIL
jgi:cysteinyl-tRNA synthetase